jgi:hypothetical protein
MALAGTIRRAVLALATTTALLLAPDTVLAATPACATTDYTTKTTDIKALNDIITIGVKSGLIAEELAVYDPITVSDQVLTVYDFSVLGYSFELTPTLESFELSGLSTIAPRSVNVSNATTLQIGTDFSGSVSVSASLSVKIAQLNHKWYQLCWTNLLKPSTCPSTTLSVSVALALKQPYLMTTDVVKMAECASGVSSSVCSDITITKMLVEVLESELSTLETSVLTRIVKVVVSSVSVGFSAVSSVSFTFGSSSSFVSVLANSLLSYSATELNKKSTAYTAFVAVLNLLFKSLLQDVIDSELASSFGATCYA